MVDLTTTDGARITFSPDKVEAVTDRDAADGQAVTCVFGPTPAMLRTSESVAALINRVGLTGKLALLTQADGSPIWVNGAAVGSIRAPLPNERPANIQTVIQLGSLAPGVQQSLPETKALLNGHGAAL
ncbi:MAG TPA: hypothetical protein VGI79_11860 [Caulobacteraceae bacterium]|jgi:hypothetical protein